MARSYSAKSCCHCGNPYTPDGPFQQYCSWACRVWSRVQIGAPDECWKWHGQKFGDGYGMAKYKTPSGQKTEPAHRAVYRIVHGSLPSKIFVCHRCDNRSCCNPAHLWQGSNLDNMQDMVNKGRSRKGPDSPRAKLTEAQALQIFHDDRPHEEIAADYPIQEMQVRRIKCKEAWRHLHDDAEGQKDG